MNVSLRSVAIGAALGAVLVSIAGYQWIRDTRAKAAATVDRERARAVADSTRAAAIERAAAERARLADSTSAAAERLAAQYQQDAARADSTAAAALARVVALEGVLDSAQSAGDSLPVLVRIVGEQRATIVAQAGSIERLRQSGSELARSLAEQRTRAANLEVETAAVRQQLATAVAEADALRRELAGLAPVPPKIRIPLPRRVVELGLALGAGYVAGKALD